MKTTPKKQLILLLSTLGLLTRRCAALKRTRHPPNFLSKTGIPTNGRRVNYGIKRHSSAHARVRGFVGVHNRGKDKVSTTPISVRLRNALLHVLYAVLASELLAQTSSLLSYLFEQGIYLGEWGIITDASTWVTCASHRSLFLV